MANVKFPMKRKEAKKANSLEESKTKSKTNQRNGKQIKVTCISGVSLKLNIALVQWLSMVWDKIPMIWDIIDLANYSLDLYDDLTKSDFHGNSNAADAKK